MAKGTRHTDRRKRGYTLVELLVYCTLLYGLLNLCTSAYFSATRVRALSDGVSASSLHTQLLSDDFVRTVHTGMGVRATVGPYTSGTDTLIVEAQPDSERPDAKRYVVYTRDAVTHRLCRVEYADSGAGVELMRAAPCSPPLKAVSFERIEGTGKADTVSMRFVLEREGRVQRAEKAHVITATMRVAARKNGE